MGSQLFLVLLLCLPHLYSGLVAALFFPFFKLPSVLQILYSYFAEVLFLCFFARFLGSIYYTIYSSLLMVTRAEAIVSFCNCIQVL